MAARGLCAHSEFSLRSFFKTVFVLRERATEFGPGPAEPGDLEMDNFCRDIVELSNNLSRLIIYFENVVGD